jgi:hypothetical protein
VLQGLILIQELQLRLSEMAEMAEIVYLTDPQLLFLVFLPHLAVVVERGH